METSLTVRLAEPGDIPRIARLFHETVHRVNVRDYSPRQLDAWSPAVGGHDLWRERLATRITFVAENGGRLTGFGELTGRGHVDAFYVHHAFQRCGVGRVLYLAMERQAQEAGIARLHAEASLTARPFFAAMGFVVERRQTVVRRGVELDNFVMSKTLHAQPRDVVRGLF